MEAKYVNPFIKSFNAVMPQMGFSSVQIGNLSVKSKEVTGSGVIIILGIVGHIRGNVVYSIDLESAKQFASTLMMGMPVEDFDDMAKSAVSELTNMLTANAATAFSNSGILIDISTPTMLQGENMSVKMNADPILCVQMLADDIPIEVNISFEN